MTDMATTPEVFRTELNRLHALALADGWMSHHMADAVDVPRPLLLKWFGGYACPKTADARDYVLTTICNKLELRPCQTK